MYVFGLILYLLGPFQHAKKCMCILLCKLLQKTGRVLVRQKQKLCWKDVEQLFRVVRVKGFYGCGCAEFYTGFGLWFKLFVFFFFRCECDTHVVEFPPKTKKEKEKKTNNRQKLKENMYEILRINDFILFMCKMATLGIWYE